MSNLVTAEYNETTQAQVYDKNFRQGSTPQIRRFNDWPSLGFLLASLVAGATAARTSGVVTVTATAHGITTGATYVGYRYFYPGSSSLAAGWYDSILTIPDANTLTFSAAGADFGSESVNGGAAYTSATDTISMIIPGNTLRDQSKLRIHHARSGGTTSTFLKGDIDHEFTPEEKIALADAVIPLCCRIHDNVNIDAILNFKKN